MRNHEQNIIIPSNSTFLTSAEAIPKDVAGEATDEFNKILCHRFEKCPADFER